MYIQINIKFIKSKLSFGFCIGSCKLILNIKKYIFYCLNCLQLIHPIKIGFNSKHLHLSAGEAEAIVQ